MAEGRSQRLQGLLVAPKHTQCDVPFWQDFLQCLHESDEITTSTRELHDEYVSYVRAHTEDARVMELSQSFRRFATAMRKAQFAVVESPIRGYKVTIGRGELRRREVGRDMPSRVASPPDVIRVSEGKGHGCFATATYYKGQIVCPYIGQIIDQAEKALRDVEDEQRGITQKIINLPQPGRFLDGSRSPDGQLLDVTRNPGAAMNNSATSPNCKIQQVEGEVVMVATTTIPKGAECLWWYGDARPGMPAWLRE